MKLIIDIDEEDFCKIHNETGVIMLQKTNIVESILQGTPFEEELEKIKAEIEKECHIDDYDIKIVDLNDIDKIIDNHISELKGENEC